MAARWMRSVGFDLSLIIGPPFLTALAVLLIPALRSPETPLWGWVLFVIGVDVAHVYASMYRTYLDPKEFARRKSLYVNIPLMCWGAGVVLYRHSAFLFWRCLAYLAVFHFVRQQYGFMRIYQRLQGLRSRLDDAIDQVAIYSTMLYPLAFWHTDTARRFVWFIEGDFFRIPARLPDFITWLYALILALFAGRQIYLFHRHGKINWGKCGIVGSTAVSWYVGIVALNSDFAFTITNVVAHGIPYFALVWLYGNRKWGASRSWMGAVHKPATLLLFFLPLLALAYIEEGAWDFLVWKEHASVFGGWLLDVQLPQAALALIVPFLALPQSTHYALDAWIWKLDGSNPGLREYLFGTPQPKQTGKFPATSTAVTA